jgi:acyl-CoA reductase-like NAD-dependent aldehyde dehydrogenase
MTFLDSLDPADQALLQTYFQPVSFPKDACILQAGEPGNGCYLIDAGEVRLELVSPETDSDSVLGYVRAGDFLGEFSLCDSQPRSASAFAETPVEARWLGREDFDRLCAEHPRAGLAIQRALSATLSAKLRETNRRLSEYLFADEADAATNALVARAASAQRAFARCGEAEVDALIAELAQAFADRAEEFARATVEETRMGDVADKTAKNRFASLEVARSLAGRPAGGLVETRETGPRVDTFAAPAGVVLGLIPVTNPVATIIFKNLVCLKARNAVLLSIHRSAQKVGGRAAALAREVLRKRGHPEDLVLPIEGRSSRRTTAMFMKHRGVALILATGGPSMVEAAYSSGTPAIGVGAGNAPCWIAPDADLDRAAALVVGSKSFDCGVICGSENNLVVDAAVRAAFVAALEAKGAAVLTPDETRRFCAQVFDPADGHLRKEVIGRPAAETAAACGVRRSHPIRLIVAPATRADLSGPLAAEKLAPMLSLFTASGDDDAIALCRAILGRAGRGHTAAVHTASQERARRFAEAIEASRIVANAGSAQGCIGLGTGLAPSLTLGCGYLGGNSTSDNVTYSHLLNYQRLAWGTA